jgi:hypothetical protein
MEQEIARAICATVRGLLDADGIAEFAKCVKGAIGRAVIDYDDFLCGPCLVEGALDGGGDPLPRVVARDAYGDEVWHVCEGKLRAVELGNLNNR